MVETIDFKTIYLKTNQGHGKARRKALEVCSNELVALMDADDISLSNRFELQLRRFISDNSLDIVGGQISEFSGNESNIIGIRQVPQLHAQIREYIKKRCPMNQMTVMFKKSAVDASGGYIDWYCNEDYYLWIRMLQRGFKFANVPEILVNVRAGEEMCARRGGWRYFRSEAKLQKYMLRNRMISVPRYIYNVVIRFGGEVVLTNKFRAKAFKLLRKNKDEVFLQVTKSINDVSSKSDNTDEKKYPSFSVAMCVYGKDNPIWFEKALKSVIVDQVAKPSEVVLVIDGPVPEAIQKVIEKYKGICGVCDF